MNLLLKIKHGLLIYSYKTTKSSFGIDIFYILHFLKFFIIKWLLDR